MAAVMPAIKHVVGQQVFGQAAFKVKAAAAVPERKVQKMVRNNVEANTIASAGQIETMIPQDNRQEAVEVLDFLRTLEDGEEKEMLAFLRGVQFGKRMGAGTAVAG